MWLAPLSVPLAAAFGMWSEPASSYVVSAPGRSAVRTHSTRPREGEQVVAQSRTRHRWPRDDTLHICITIVLPWPTSLLGRRDAKEGQGLFSLHVGFGWAGLGLGPLRPQASIQQPPRTADAHSREQQEEVEKGASVPVQSAAQLENFLRYGEARWAAVSLSVWPAGVYISPARLIYGRLALSSRLQSLPSLPNPR